MNAQPITQKDLLAVSTDAQMQALRQQKQEQMKMSDEPQTDTTTFLANFKPGVEIKFVDLGQLPQIIQMCECIIDHKSVEYLNSIPKFATLIEQFKRAEVDQRKEMNIQPSEDVVIGSVKLLSFPEQSVSFIMGQLDVDQKDAMKYFTKLVTFNLQTQLIDKGCSPFLINIPRVLDHISQKAEENLAQQVFLQSKLFLNWMYYREYLSHKGLCRHSVHDVVELLLFSVCDEYVLPECVKANSVLTHYPSKSQLKGGYQVQLWSIYLQQQHKLMCWVLEQLCGADRSDIIQKSVDVIFGVLEQHKTLVVHILMDTMFYLLYAIDIDRFDFKNFGDLSVDVPQSTIIDRYDPMKFSLYRDQAHQGKEDDMKDQQKLYSSFVIALPGWKQFAGLKCMKGTQMSAEDKLRLVEKQMDAQMSRQTATQRLAK